MKENGIIFFFLFPLEMLDWNNISLQQMIQATSWDGKENDILKFINFTLMPLAKQHHGGVITEEGDVPCYLQVVYISDVPQIRVLTIDPETKIVNVPLTSNSASTNELLLKNFIRDFPKATFINADKKRFFFFVHNKEAKRSERIEDFGDGEIHGSVCYENFRYILSQATRSTRVTVCREPDAQ